MIAKPPLPKRKLTPQHWQLFLQMLPAITRIARTAFKSRDPEARDELTAEVVASAYLMFVSLVERGHESLAYPTPLAMFGIRRAQDGRRVGTRLNARDLSSAYCQGPKGIRIRRLDRYDAAEGEWQETLVEDRRAGPAEIAAARIDVGDWFARLSRRDKLIAGALALGMTTGEAAEESSVSPSRIAHKRREFHDSWRRFQGEEALAADLKVPTKPCQRSLTCSRA